MQQKTRGLVRAGPRPASATDGTFWVGFDLYSPALGEYTYRLFEVTYPPQLFPVTLAAAGEAQTACNLSQLEQLLESVLRSPRTKQVVEAITARHGARAGGSRMIEAVRCGCEGPPKAAVTCEQLDLW